MQYSKKYYKSRRFLVLSSVVLLASCAVKRQSSSPEAIHGYQSKSLEDSSFFVKIVGDGALCTGTLVAPDVVVTAHHCVYDHKDRESRGWRPRELKIYKSSTDLKEGGVSHIEVSRVYPESIRSTFLHDSCQNIDFSNRSEQTERCDLAVLRLKDNIVGRYHPQILLKPVPKYHCFASFSFGAKSERERVDPTKKLQCGFNHFSNVQKDFLYSEHFKDLHQYRRELGDGFGVGFASGDSGAAALIYNPNAPKVRGAGSFYIAGIVIRPDASSSSFAKQVTIMVSVSSVSSRFLLEAAFRDVSPMYFKDFFFDEDVPKLRGPEEHDWPVFITKQGKDFVVAQSMFPARSNGQNLFSRGEVLTEVNGFPIKNARDLLEQTYRSCPYLHYQKVIGEELKTRKVKLIDHKIHDDKVAVKKNRFDVETSRLCHH